MFQKNCNTKRDNLCYYVFDFIMTMKNFSEVNFKFLNRNIYFLHKPSLISQI